MDRSSAAAVRRRKRALDEIGERGGARPLFMGRGKLERDGTRIVGALDFGTDAEQSPTLLRREERGGSDLWARLISCGGSLRGRGSRLAPAKLGCATGPGKPGFGPISEERGPALEWPNGALQGERRRPAWERDGPRQQQAFGPKRRRKRIPFFPITFQSKF